MSDKINFNKKDDKEWALVDTTDLTGDDSDDSTEYPCLMKVRRIEPVVVGNVTVSSDDSSGSADSNLIRWDTRRILSQYYVDRNEMYYPVNDFSTSSGSSPLSDKNEDDKENKPSTSKDTKMKDKIEDDKENQPSTSKAGLADMKVVAKKKEPESDSDSDSFSIISYPTDEDEKAHSSGRNKAIQYEETWFQLVRNYMTQLDNTKMLMGTIIFAAISMMCAQHFTNPKGFDDTLSSDQFTDKLDPTADYYSMLDPVEYCKERHNNEDRFFEVKIKKCLKNVHSHNEKLRQKLQQDQKDLIRKYNENKNKTFYISCLHKRNNLKIKEEFLRAKERFLIQKEYELIKTELKLLKEASLLRSKYESQHLKNINSTGANQFHKDDFKRFKNDRKLLKPLKKFDERKNYDQFKSETPKEKIKEYDKKYPKYEKKYKNYDKSDKFHKKDLNLDKKYKYERSKPSKGEKNDFIIINKKNEKNNTLNGLWYTKMHKSRNDLRKNPCDWMNCSKFKRNRYNWYIKLMQNRETLRFKQI